jgi:lipoprotein-anchoring transpeptidase ErfK/SrfK
MPALFLAFLLAVTAATANVAGFALRAQALDQRWQAAEAAGVPAASLAEARRELAAEEARRAGPVPYAVVSGAAYADPFGGPESSADAAYRSALGAARQRAAAALARRDDAGGPNDGGLAVRVVRLAAASRPDDADALARRWNAEAAALEAARSQLAADAGGLTGGLPADVVAGSSGLSDLVSRAGQGGIDTASADAALVAADLYLARPYPDLVARHQQIAALLRSETDRLAGRLDADATLTADANLVPVVTRYGAGDEFKGRLDQVRASLTAAEAAQDGGAVDAAVTAVQRLDADLRAAAGGWLPTAGIPCEPNAPAQLIEIHLATQQLVAYENGCPILRTPVTSGRSVLPTGRGTFHIYYKAARYQMISPWPPSSSLSYPTTWVSDAMEFIGNGTFIHSADWEPAGSFGPGSQDGAFASHGCVHVMDDPLQRLYDWAAIGATVVVAD